MVGMVTSIFGQTSQELQKKRDAELRAKKNQMLSTARSPEAVFGTSLGSTIGNRLATGLFDAFGLDEEMNKARETDAKQAALDEAIANANTTEEKLRILAGGLSDAGKTTQAIDVFKQYEQAKNNRIEREQLAQKEAKEAAQQAAQQKALSELSGAPFDPVAIENARSKGVSGAEVLDLQNDFAVSTKLQNDLADKELIRSLKNEVAQNADLGSLEYNKGMADRLIAAGRPGLAEGFRSDQARQEEIKLKAQQAEFSSRKSFFDTRNLNMYSYSPTTKKWFDDSGNSIEKPKGSIVPYSMTTYNDATEKMQDRNLEFSTVSSSSNQLKNIINDPSFEDITGPFFSTATAKRALTELFGGKGSSTLQTIRSFTMDHTLSAMQKLGGNDSFQELKKIEAAFPSETDDPRVWKSFFANEYADGLYKSIRKAFGEERAIAELTNFLNNTLTTSEFSDLSSGKNGLLKPNSFAYKLRGKLNVKTLNPDSIAAREAARVDSIVNKYPD